MADIPDQHVARAAMTLRDVYGSGNPCSPLNEEIPADDIATGYAVQNTNTDHWIAEGRRLVGRKIGLTAKTVQTQLGVDQPDYGMLFGDMAYADGETIPMSRLIQPRIEGEIAFVLKEDLDSVDLTMADVLGAVDFALAAFEVVDSRIADWQIKIMDTIADNASSGLFVLGTRPVKLDAFDPRSCSMSLESRGVAVSVGSGAACLGNPLTALLWLGKTMVEVERPLKSGDIVLSGALGPMVSVTPGDAYELKISGLGSVRAIFSAE